MSYPNHGSPEHNWPQHGYPGQPPVYGSQQPYAPQAYGAPDGRGAGGRPGTVTTAAVFAFVFAGLVILTKVVALLILATHTSAAIADWGVGAVAANYAILLGKLTAGALLVWGGVAALNGRTGRILVGASVTAAVLSLLGIVVSVVTSPGTGYWFVNSFLELAFATIILVLILLPSSSEFFRARRVRAI